MDALREQLAAYAHDEAWGHWMRYLLGVCRLEPDGSVVIPPDKAVRWMRQATTVYAALPDDERESDRRQADRILAIVGRPAAQPDPLAAHIPPADQWPDDAVAWCVEASGHAYWHVASRDGRWELYPDQWVPLPPGYDWRQSLRLRPQTGA